MSSGSEHSFPSRKVVSTRVYESAPVLPAQQEVVSTTQTEEWTTKKKKDKLVTKQIKTRVKREIVVTEDGEILEDSGPLVTTDTTEETKTDEQEDVEHKTSGIGDPGPGWTLVPGSKVVHETKKLNTTSHETKEEKNESEITEEIGGLTREDIARALKHKERIAIKLRKDSTSTNDSGPRLHSSRSRKIVDTEEVDKVSEFKDGQLSTETKKTSNREEHFDGGRSSTSSEDDREPVIERVEKKYWTPLGAEEHQRTSSPAVSSGRSSSSKNVKINSRVEVADGTNQNSKDSHSREKEKVRVTSPSSFHFSHLQQVDGRLISSSPPLPPPPTSHVYRISTDHVENKNKINSEIKKGIVGEDETENRQKTFKWVENHFGSQDFEDSGILTEASTNDSPTFKKEYYIPITSETDGSTYRRIHHSKRQQMPTERKGKYRAPEPPVSPPATSRVSFEKDHGSRPSSTTTNKTDSQWTTQSGSTLGTNAPKKQYFLGEDPGFGQRFTGMIDVCNRKPSEDGYQNTDSAYSTLSLSRPHHRIQKFEPPHQKCSTLGRPTDLRLKQPINPNLTNGNNKLNGASSVTNVHKSTFVDTNSPPSVTDIIHSLRSKEFLEKENSAVSIRDDDSVFDIRSVSHLRSRPATILRRQQLEPPPSTLTKPKPVKSKQHVIKITINSDGSECSSPVNSPSITKNGNHYYSQQFDVKSENNTRNEQRRNSHATNGGTVGDSMVRNAINNLMKNNVSNGDRNNSNSDRSYNSLLRTNSPRGTSNLTKSRVYLATSSPNVSKLVTKEPDIIKTSSKYCKVTNNNNYNNFKGNNRSQSIHNLNSHNDDWEPQKAFPATNGVYSIDGVTRLNVDKNNRNGHQQNGGKPSQFIKREINNGGIKNAHHYHRSNNFSEDYRKNYRNCNYVPYTTTYSPPSSPTDYVNGHHHFKLPSPIPPQSRSSSSPPSSPLPNLTRPFSPNYNRDYDSSNYYNVRPRTRSSAIRTPSFNSRSPSPSSTFSRRPPSPVLPSRSKRASSIGDDAASSISGRSQSTNCTGSVGSRAGNSSDASQLGEKIVSTSRRKVTTTTTQKREVEKPQNDYYYENAITGSLSRDQNKKLNGHIKHGNNMNGNGIRSQKDYISNR